MPLIPVTIEQAAAGGNTVLIEEITVGAGGQANIDFTGIAQIYRHLQLKVLARAEAASADMRLTFNNDTGSNYDWELIAANTGVSAAEGVGTAFIRIGSLPGSGAPANTFGSTVIEIPFYRDSQHKTLSYMQQLKLAASSTNIFTVPGTGLWRNTAAVTQITLALSSGDFEQGSTALLYGKVTTGQSAVSGMPVGTTVFLFPGMQWTSTSGTFARVVDANQHLDYLQAATPAQNNIATLDEVYLDEGTWVVDCYGISNADRAIWSIQLDGSIVATADFYSASLTFNKKVTSSSFDVSSEGLKMVSVTNPTRNGSANNWYLSMTALRFRKTA